MKYLCLIYQNEDDAGAFRALPRAEQEAGLQEFRDFHASITRGGQYVASEALQPASSATTVRVRGGRVATTDGPFAETKEQLGGFYLVEARDLNEAIQIAARIPAARYGAVEVRPVRDWQRDSR